MGFSAVFQGGADAVGSGTNACKPLMRLNLPTRQSALLLCSLAVPTTFEACLSLFFCCNEILEQNQLLVHSSRVQSRQREQETTDHVTSTVGGGRRDEGALQLCSLAPLTQSRALGRLWCPHICGSHLFN